MSIEASIEAKPKRRLNDFLGTWQVAREICHAAQPPARFEGQAQWLADGSGARYVERGTLRIAGQASMTATQSYLWRRDLTVCFPDGRLFHHVPARGGPVSHLCGADLYEGGYDFADWPEFVVTWQVRGPRKNYTMRTVYRR